MYGGVGRVHPKGAVAASRSGERDLATSDLNRERLLSVQCPHFDRLFLPVCK